MALNRIESGTVADAYLTLLADRGIDYLFANAGTDFAPLIESYAKLDSTGVRVPKPVTVPHENVAVSMALGTDVSANDRGEVGHGPQREDFSPFQVPPSVLARDHPD